MSAFDTTYTAGQKKFIEQMARKKLVDWCNQVLTEDTGGIIALDWCDPYVHYAANRKSPWLSDKGAGNFKILATGWAAAASFLKR